MNTDFNDILKIEGLNHKGYGTIPKLVMQDQRLPINAKAIYAYFCSFAGVGNSAFPSRDKICYDLNINKDTLTKYFKYLTAYGYIKTIQNNAVNGKFANNIYILASNPTINQDALNNLLNKPSVKKEAKNLQKQTDPPCPKISDTVSSDTVTPDTVLPDTVISDTNINSLKINNLKNNKTTTTIDSKDKVSKNLSEDVAAENSSLFKIADIFNKLTTKSPSSKDANAIMEALNRPLAVPITNKLREQIIIDTLIRVYKNFKASNPASNINSFKYFLNPISDEFKKYELKNNNQYSEHQKPTENKYIDEYGRMHDFSKLATNR